MGLQGRELTLKTIPRIGVWDANKQGSNKNRWKPYDIINVIVTHFAT